jgi:hypothetical protein
VAVKLKKSNQFVGGPEAPLEARARVRLHGQRDKRVHSSSGKAVRIGGTLSARVAADNCRHWMM